MSFSSKSKYRSLLIPCRALACLVMSKIDIFYLALRSRYRGFFPYQTLLSLQHALSADDCLIISRQTVEHSDASDVLRRRLLEQVVEDLRSEVVRRVVVATDSGTQLLHRAQL